MSSTFATLPGRYNSTGLFGKSKPQPVYLQFVPGIVLDVVINNESPAYKSDRDINSILAKSHVSSKKGLNLKGPGKKRYYPLFRGMTDTPIKGDQVLLCTFAGVDYYMGPINTVNSPNWNIDHMNLKNADELGGIAKSVPGSKKLNKYGVSSNFPASKKIKRMQKKFNKPLDDVDERIKAETTLETHGDMMFEGRHGNSIRVGSRDYHPYILFSNGRAFMNEHESLFDGSTFMLSNFGTIHQHFPSDWKVEEEEEPEQVLFTLSSDTVGEDKEDGQKRMIGAKDPEDSESKGLYNYVYNGVQTFLNSDKITFNSKLDDISLSAFQNIILGAGNTLHFVSENETIIEASNIYLGRQSKEKNEPLVLGEQLRKFLTEFIDVVSEAQGMCQGAPIPVMDGTSSPLKVKLAQLKNKINNKENAPFNSEYHFIEDNGNKPE